MGQYLFDQYSLLHFSVGVVFYFWGISLKTWIIFHIIFEILENTPQGIHFIDKNLAGWWPGGKVEPDSLLNIFGDILIGTIGWIVAYQLDKIGKKRKWYALSQ